MLFGHSGEWRFSAAGRVLAFAEAPAPLPLPPALLRLRCIRRHGRPHILTHINEQVVAVLLARPRRPRRLPNSQLAALSFVIAGILPRP